MMYKPYYSNILIISSMFYFFTAFADYFITILAYAYYGDLFFQLESNPFICDIVKMGIPPAHMVIIPITVAFLSCYFRNIANKMNIDSMISDRVIWSMGFAICLMIMMGILHLLGFISWFYHGAF